MRTTAGALEGQPLDVVTGDAELPEDLEELRGIGVALDARAAELACNMGELNQAIAAETADLTSDDAVVSLFLEVVRLESPSG